MQKAKIILVANFTALFILIITTPYFIRNGLPWVEEETVEGFFLGLELFALIFFFRQYDDLVRRKEEEAWLLDVKLKSKERELLNAFQYLGKVNVQISMVQSLLEKMRIPSTRNQLREAYSELLRLVCSATGEMCATVRIVDLQTGRTMSEQAESIEEPAYCHNLRLGNSELIKKAKNHDRSGVDGFSVFYSSAENFYVRAFIVVPNAKRSRFGKEEINFFEAVANQCEIMFLLYNSKYFKNKSDNEQ